MAQGSVSLQTDHPQGVRHQEKKMTELRQHLIFGMSFTDHLVKEARMIGIINTIHFNTIFGTSWVAPDHLELLKKLKERESFKISNIGPLFLKR